MFACGSLGMRWRSPHITHLVLIKESPELALVHMGTRYIECVGQTLYFLFGVCKVSLLLIFYFSGRDIRCKRSAAVVASKQH